MPTSSICAIIPTYNRAAMLRQCIDSVLAQSRPANEIIVVNDGSTDDTENVVKSYGSRVTLISKENGGKASALNAALAQCASDYVWICDDDDIAASDGLRHLATALDADPSTGFAYGTFRIFRDEAPERHSSPPTYWARAEEPNAKIAFLEEMFTFQFAMLVRRSLYRAAGPFREDLIRSQDYDMTLQLTRHARPVYVPEIIFFQRQHEGTRGSSTDLFSAGKNEQKWLVYDRKIFADVAKNYDLDEFTPTFARQWETPLARRAALIERACILAKHAIWKEAIADFNEASKLSSAPATPQELSLAESVIRTLPAWQTLSAEPDLVARLHACFRANEYGHRIVLAACRPLVWHARKMFQKGNVSGGTCILRLLVNIAEISGAFSRITASFLERSGKRKT